MSTIKISKSKERTQDRNFFKSTPLFTVVATRDRQWWIQQLWCGWPGGGGSMGCGVVCAMGGQLQRGQWRGWHKGDRDAGVGMGVGAGMGGAAVAAGTAVHLDSQL
jgi:hypothetical protein